MSPLHIYLLNTDDGSIMQLSPSYDIYGEPAAWYDINRDPAWSADGEWLVFTRAIFNGEGPSLWIISHTVEDLFALTTDLSAKYLEAVTWIMSQ